LRAGDERRSGSVFLKGTKLDGRKETSKSGAYGP